MKVRRNLVGVWCSVMAVPLLVLVGCSQGTAIPATGGDDSSASPEQRFFKAAAQGDVATLKSLLAQDASLIDAYGMQGIAPLHAAAQKGQNEAVKFLLENGADPLVQDEDGSTASNTARGEGHPDTAQIIEEAAAKKSGAPAQ